MDVRFFRGKATHECWMDEIRQWKRYPIMVPSMKPVTFEMIPPGGVVPMVDIRDYATVVHIGPAAPYPVKPARIQMPTQMTVKVDYMTGIDPEMKEALTYELLYRHPEIKTAYLYETILPKDYPLSGWVTLIWKVWFHDA